MNASSTYTSKKRQKSDIDWSAWLTEHGSFLLLFARQQCRSEADAEDVLQEALVQLVNAVKSRAFDGDSSKWRSYVCVAIRHLAMDRGRREQVRKNYEVAQQEVMSEGIEEMPWLASSADNDYVRKKVENALKQLAPDAAEVVVLHMWGGHTFQQIADMTGTKLSTVTSRYRYSLQHMREYLTTNPIED